MKIIGFINLFIRANLIISLTTQMFLPESILSITGPSISLSNTVISEGDDYATRVLALPWDMNNDPYPGPTTVFKKDVDLESISSSNGRWKFTTNGPHPTIWFLWTGIDETQKVLRMGDRLPIDTSKYKLLSLKLCSTKTERGIFYWFYTQAPHDPNDPSKTGFSKYFNINTGCHLYTFDMTQFPKLQGDWTGNIMGLRFNPAIFNESIELEIDWARLTTIDTSNIVSMNWQGVTPGSTLFFYASQTSCGIDGILIGTELDSQEKGTFDWGSTLQNNDQGTPYPIPESFEPGKYNIFMLENGVGSPICAISHLELHKAPILKFLRPSIISGPDYATEELGDPWGMSNPEDIIRTNDVITYNFTDGIFNVTSNSHKSWFELNSGPPIDTNKYKYVTYRMYVEGWQSIAEGWVSRFFWWDIGPGSDPSATVAQIVFEGWHTYSLDLSEALMLEENPRDWDGFPTGFRYDPLETPGPMKYHLDFFILTGDEIITRGDPFNIVFETSSQSGLDITFFYDMDKNPKNGRILAISPEPLGNYLLYLPFISSENRDPEEKEIDLLNGDRWVWDTTDVLAGTYYLSADISDGVMTTTWYSELPVFVE